MSGVARLGDSIIGMTSGEHAGHDSPHPPVPITGSIADNCSSNVFVNGIAVAYIGSVTVENDACCGSAKGSVSGGSSTVFVNGHGIARNGDAIAPHNGVATISSGSSDVFA